MADPTRRLLAVAGVPADAWLEGGVDLDSRAAVRELLAKAKPPLGTVARENAETACRWLTEGTPELDTVQFAESCTRKRGTGKRDWSHPNSCC